MTAVQHGGLTPEAWARHPQGRQILMIANEMNRASKLFGPFKMPSQGAQIRITSIKCSPE